MAGWNPWHGCRKISEGCLHCYVYRMDAAHGKDSSQIAKTQAYDLPIRKNRKGQYQIPSGETVYTCFTSDFLLEDADPWRMTAWDMIRARQDLRFYFVTKRIHRFWNCLPPDWGEGWEHVYVSCTVESQQQAEKRLPLFLQAPIRHKSILCEPLLGPIELSPWLTQEIEEVSAGGESGPEARVCRYEWVQDLSRQCHRAGVPFHFRQTGALFEKDGRLYRIPRQYQSSQARKAGIDSR